MNDINHIIINEARSWLGTSFHHQGRLKKTDNHNGGCDCIGFIIGVADNVGLKLKDKPFSHYDNLSYSRYPKKNNLEKICNQFMQKISIAESVSGDILLFKFDKHPQHLAFKSEDKNIIHCYIKSRGVVEHVLDEIWQTRIVSCYRFY